jgi:hypothetical protein
MKTVRRLGYWKLDDASNVNHSHAGAAHLLDSRFSPFVFLFPRDTASEWLCVCSSLIQRNLLSPLLTKSPSTPAAHAQPLVTDSPLLAVLACCWSP